jgi:WhiB family redox-sensing transcriptional regulator
MGLRHAGADVSWQDRAICTGTHPDFFHPQRGEGPEVKRAQEICETCPVIAECREYALTYREPFGVWGGLSQRQREKEWKARAHGGTTLDNLDREGQRRAS